MRKLHRHKEALLDVDTFTREFGRELRSGSAAIMCGAGVSIDSGLPSWENLIGPARVALGLPDTFKDLTLVATYYVSQVEGGRARLTDDITKALRSKHSGPNDVHRALWSLPVRYIWSLNFDDLLENAISPTAHVIATDTEMKGSLGFSQRAVVKIHGGLSELSSKKDPRELVVTRDDFDRYLSRFPRTWSRLLADFHTKSMLFVGISFADPNMQQLLRLVRTASSPITQQHYAIVGPPPTDPAEVALRNLQLDDLRRGGVEAVSLADFAELATVVERLAVASRAPNVLISGDIDPNDLAGHDFLKTLGVILASDTDNPINLVHGGGVAGLTCSDAFASHLEALDVYRANRVHMIRRSAPRSVNVPRHGHVTFPGPDRKDVRRTLCKEASVVVAIGGKNGTQQEIDEADRQEVLVLPVPISAGVSVNRWTQDVASNAPSARYMKHKQGLAAVQWAEITARSIREHLFGVGGKP